MMMSPAAKYEVGIGFLRTICVCVRRDADSVRLLAFFSFM